MMETGDILLTRNTEEVGNDSPGFWNHAAIYVGENKVIEAQAELDSVIAVLLTTFWARYPEIIVLRYTNKQIAERASQEARGIHGSSYRKIASVFKKMRRQRRGENCVSVVRKAYAKATQYDPRWQVPDHIYQEVDNHNLEIVEHKKDYMGWVKPEKWFELS